jgi:hypothetical protein
MSRISSKINKGSGNRPAVDPTSMIVPSGVHSRRPADNAPDAQKIQFPKNVKPHFLTMMVKGFIHNGYRLVDMDEISASFEREPEKTWHETNPVTQKPAVEIRTDQNKMGSLLTAIEEVEEEEEKFDAEGQKLEPINVTPTKAKAVPSPPGAPKKPRKNPKKVTFQPSEPIKAIVIKESEPIVMQPVTKEGATEFQKVLKPKPKNEKVAIEPVSLSLPQATPTNFPITGVEEKATKAKRSRKRKALQDISSEDKKRALSEVKQSAQKSTPAPGKENKPRGGKGRKQKNPKHMDVKSGMLAIVEQSEQFQKTLKEAQEQKKEEEEEEEQEEDSNTDDGDMSTFAVPNDYEMPGSPADLEKWVQELHEKEVGELGLSLE